MGAKGKGKKKDEVAQAESQEILLRTFSDDPTLGLREEEAARRLEVYGKNVIKVERKVTWYATLIGAILHPFNFVLIALAVVAVATGDYRTFTVMLSMVVLSVFLRFWQETKAHSEAESLKKMVHNKARVIRRQVTNVDGIETEEAVPKDIMIEDVVVGDIVKLGAGDMIPGDIRLIQAKDLFVSQSALTGESMPVEKVSSTYLKEKDGELTDGESFRPELPPLEEEPAVESIWSMFRSWFRQTILRSAGDPPKKTMRRKRKVAHRLERPDCCFLGTSVVSGTATGIVERTGANTLFGELAKELSKKKPPTSFQIGVKKVSYILISFMLIMAPIVFILNGVITKDWLQALLFSVAVAVGLVPEMLPMIVNANLARGAFVMSKKKAIVKKLESIMNFGAMDILCTDKTGTLTQDKVILLKHMSLNERESPRVVLHAYLNSTFQTGLKNLLDLAVINYVEVSEESPFRSSLKSAPQPENSEGNPQFETLEEAVENFKSDYTKIDEIPFDFVRRRMSVILRNNKTGKNLLVCKGAVEELLSISRFMEDPETGEVKVFEEEKFKQAMTLGHKLNREGLRVIAVAYREVDENLEAGALKPSDEKDLVLLGFTAFLDPPKESSAPAIAELIANGITVKVLTGDNDEVCKTICEQVGLPIEGIITGKELEDRVGAAPNPLSEDSTENVVVINDDMKQKALDEITSKTTIFAKLTPLQKAEVVASLRRQGHVVGFLGDGINDSAAFLEADVGISVDSAVDVAKENADIILLEKSLMVLVKGVRLGRLTYGNTIKYIKMTASSNFGNVFSVLIASAWLPFLPMKPVHLVVQNLLYDFSQVAIPWDNMDDDFITTPKNWSANGITWFMLFMGPVSSVFDVCTFLTMWYYFGAQTPESQTLFQTAWFVEGLLTQTLIVHMIRTDKIPFIQSRPSLVLFCTTMVVMGVGIALPFTPINTFFSMTPLPAMYFPFLFAFLAGYCILSQIVKFIFIKIFKEWM